MIKKIENLDNLTKLYTINLCHNFITKIENLSEFLIKVNIFEIITFHNKCSTGILPALNTLQISHNKLTTIEDIVNLADCVELKIVDLLYNNLSNPKIIEVSNKRRLKC